MSENQKLHEYNLTASWNGGLNGEGAISVGQLKTPVSAPVELGGPGKGTNPEEMLLGASATCYLITLAAILQRRQLPLEKLSLTSQGFLNTEGALRYTKIIHRPQILLGSSATDEQRKVAQDATARAEKACLVSNAIRGNVEVIIEPNIS